MSSVDRKVRNFLSMCAVTAATLLASCSPSNDAQVVVEEKPMAQQRIPLGSHKMKTLPESQKALNVKRTSKWDDFYSQNRSSEQKAYCVAKTKSKFTSFTDWIFTVESVSSQDNKPKMITLVMACKTFDVPYHNFIRPIFLSENSVVLASGKFNSNTLVDVEVTLVLDD